MQGAVPLGPLMHVCAASEISPREEDRVIEALLVYKYWIFILGRFERI